MFPGVNGFHWTAGHIIFLSIFFTVLMIVATTVVSAAFRTRRSLRTASIDSIRWHHEFEELPQRDRRCRHELAGQIDRRECPNAFDCRHCQEHPKFALAAPAVDVNVQGVDYPAERLYHRGHTWVEPQPDGTALVGLDDIAAHVIGTPDRVELPPEGALLNANGTGWHMEKDGHDVRVLSPIDGQVVGAGGPSEGFYLRVKPATNDFRHLLKGAEVSGWVNRELERLQVTLLPPHALASLPDGGVLVHDLIANMPQADWDKVLGEIFLEP